MFSAIHVDCVVVFEVSHDRTMFHVIYVDDVVVLEDFYERTMIYVIHVDYMISLEVSGDVPRKLRVLHLYVRDISLQNDVSCSPRGLRSVP